MAFFCYSYLCRNTFLWDPKKRNVRKVLKTVGREVGGMRSPVNTSEANYYRKLNSLKQLTRKSTLWASDRRCWPQTVGHQAALEPVLISYLPSDLVFQLLLLLLVVLRVEVWAAGHGQLLDQPLHLLLLLLPLLHLQLLVFPPVVDHALGAWGADRFAFGTGLNLRVDALCGIVFTGDEWSSLIMINVVLLWP